MIFLNHVRRSAAVLLLIAAASPTIAQVPSNELESIDAATRSMWLISGTVVDADSNKPVKAFTVTPGSLSTDDQGKTAVRWRDNLKREMSNGKLLWPRTSGFSLMRFRITAPGYQPAVTHRIWRGGPHTRMLVRIKPEESPKKAGTATAPR